MFLRYLLWSLTLFWISFPSLALWKSNPVLGITGGVIRQSGQFGVGYLPTILPNLKQANVIDDFRNYGPLVGVLGGYHWRCNEWILGLELSGEWNKAHKYHLFGFPEQANVFLTRNQFKHSPMIGLTGSYAYQFSPLFIGIMRGGVEWSKDKLSSIYYNNPIAYQPDFLLENTTKRDAFRILWGFGAEFPLSRLLGFRIEYNYHAQTDKIRTQARTEDNNANPLFSTNTRPKIHSIKGSLIWNIR